MILYNILYNQILYRYYFLQLFISQNNIEVFIGYRFTYTKSRGNTMYIQNNVITAGIRTIGHDFERKQTRSVNL